MAINKKKTLIGAGTGAAKGFATGGPVGALVGGGLGLAKGLLGGGGEQPSTVVPGTKSEAPPSPLPPYAMPSASFDIDKQNRKLRMNNIFGL